MLVPVIEFCGIVISMIGTQEVFQLIISVQMPFQNLIFCYHAWKEEGFSQISDKFPCVLEYFSCKTGILELQSWTGRVSMNFI